MLRGTFNKYYSKYLLHITLVLFLCSYTNRNCNVMCDREELYDNMIRFEIIEGGTKYGWKRTILHNTFLLCENQYMLEKKSKNIERVKVFEFRKKELDIDKFYDLLCFLERNRNKIVDTIIDYPNFEVLGDFPTTFLFRLPNNVHKRIVYIDSKEKNQFLDSLIILTNCLIPKKYIEHYKVYPLYRSEQ